LLMHYCSWIPYQERIDKSEIPFHKTCPEFIEGLGQQDFVHLL